VPPIRFDAKDPQLGVANIKSVVQRRKSEPGVETAKRCHGSYYAGVIDVIHLASLAAGPRYPLAVKHQAFWVI
jgi:hypothetical protein